MFLNSFWEVKSCSKAILAYSLRHGKSPCFSEVTILHARLGLVCRFNSATLWFGQVGLDLTLEPLPS